MRTHSPARLRPSWNRARHVRSRPAIHRQSAANDPRLHKRLVHQTADHLRDIRRYFTNSRSMPSAAERLEPVSHARRLCALVVRLVVRWTRSPSVLPRTRSHWQDGTSSSAAARRVPSFAALPRRQARRRRGPLLSRDLFPHRARATET